MDLLSLKWELLKLSPQDDERCGVVLASGDILELSNRSTYPYNSFIISEADVQPYKAEMVATWHTHPRGPNNLSIDAYNTFLELPDIAHLIITHKSVSLYQTEGDYVMNKGRRLLNGHG